MDTVSHIIIGFGLGALAQMDPVISTNSALSTAVLVGTVVGSNAPDFDFFYRLKGKSSYFRNHRGWSHSLPAIPLWSILTTAAILPFFPGSSMSHLFLWILLAVTLHVLLDLFNVNGAQALRPFSEKWLSLDFLPLIDPYIIMLHILGFSLLPFFETGRVFTFIYLAMVVYLLARLIFTQYTKWKLSQHFQNAFRVKMIPKISPFHWNILIETNQDFLFGSYSMGEFWIEHTFSKKVEYPGLVIDSSQNPEVESFLRSTHFAYPFVQKRKSGYFIYWKDLRFRSKKFFPKLTIMFISLDYKKHASYTGKLTSIKHYKKVVKKLETSI
ncbi:inner membrane protein [Neobacillus niacini]|uniref:metal-dependent hydrolase n=1 Tax=Neobacillus niacini TaxID=86668 RepID=UPI00277EAC0B|nr:metal-dependent hydrolase [Neobacillus niacini]MDQ1004477.1 inner membrane protein [Neobacillus niacini]